MTREELKDEIGKTPFFILGTLVIIGVLLLPTALFFWIWDGWGNAWKLALSGVLLSAISAKAYKWFESIIYEAIDKDLEKNKKHEKPVGKFQRRMNELMEEMKNQKN